MRERELKEEIFDGCQSNGKDLRMEMRRDLDRRESDHQIEKAKRERERERKLREREREN